MGKSLKQRFEEQGIMKEEIARTIKQRGLLPVADERGVSIEALENYASSELGISDAPLLNKNFIKPNAVLAQEFISAMYAKWKEIEEENIHLKEEIRAFERENDKRNTMAKVQLLEMLEAVNLTPARA